MSSGLRRALVLGAPVVLLLLAVRLIGPRVSACYTETAAGAGYEVYEVDSGGVAFAVLTKSERGRADAEATAGRLSGFFARLRAHLPTLPLEPPAGPIRLLVFEDHSDLERFVQIDAQRDFAHNDGYFSPDRLEIAVRRRPDGEVAWDALRHEAVHLLFRASGDRLPPWLSEGLAMAFESDGADGGPEAPNRALLDAAGALLGAGARPPLAAILGFERASFGRAGNEVPYAWSAALSAFLLDPAAPARRQQFLAFVGEAMRTGATAAPDLARALGETAPSLEDQFGRWLGSERIRTRFVGSR